MKFLMIFLLDKKIMTFLMIYYFKYQNNLSQKKIFNAQQIHCSWDYKQFYCGNFLHINPLLPKANSSFSQIRKYRLPAYV